MSVLQEFNGLNGAVVSRNEINRIIALAKAENNTAVIFRLSRILNNYPDDQAFDVDLYEYPAIGLNGAQHVGSYKTALDDCGRLRKGFKFVKGAIVKVPEKQKPKAKVSRVKSTPTKKKQAAKYTETVSYKRSVALVEKKSEKEASLNKSNAEKLLRTKSAKPKLIKNKALNAPEIISDPQQTEATVMTGTEVKSIPAVRYQKSTTLKARSTNPKVKKIGQSGTDGPSDFYTVVGEVGKFLQQVERKPFQSVVITLDGMQGAGKTTTLYKFMDAFASPGNNCLFISGEEHPESSLAIEKRDKYLSAEAQKHTDITAGVKDVAELYELIKDYDIIFIDSWQKLLRMVGTIRLDEDLRQKFDGKVFVVIFQQTTTGRAKGGAEVIFDGDIIIKMVKEASFADNYAFFDKNRYTLVPIETIRYNISNGKTYNPTISDIGSGKESVPFPIQKFKFHAA